MKTFLVQDFRREQCLGMEGQAPVWAVALHKQIKFLPGAISFISPLFWIKHQNPDLVTFMAQSNQICEQTAMVLGLSIPIGVLELAAGTPVFPKNP